MKLSNDPEAKPNWMKCPDIHTKYPHLAYLHPLKMLIIARKLDTLHLVIGKWNNCYTIFNRKGEKVFLAVQENRWGQFKVKIYNVYGNEVIQIWKPFSYLFDRALVYASGNFVGSVDRIKCYPKQFLVKNTDGKVIIKIKYQGSGLYSATANGVEIGVIMKKVKGVTWNHFGVCFDRDLEMEDKVVIIGASFLIGYLKYSF